PRSTSVAAEDSWNRLSAHTGGAAPPPPPAGTRSRRAGSRAAGRVGGGGGGPGSLAGPGGDGLYRPPSGSARSPGGGGGGAGGLRVADENRAGHVAGQDVDQGPGVRRPDEALEQGQVDWSKQVGPGVEEHRRRQPPVEDGPRPQLVDHGQEAVAVEGRRHPPD